VNVGERFVIRGTVIFELSFEALQLGDRLDKAPCVVEHIQFQLRISETEQRLARDDVVARLCEQLLNLAAFHGVEIDQFLGLNFTAQREDIVKNRRLGSPDAELFGGDSKRTIIQFANHVRPEEPEYHKQADRGRDLKMLVAPPRAGDGYIHGMCHLE
jgi:hypothetical protein